MAGKPNIRSIRFSDELAELIDRQAGDTFTEKFEGLITRCVWELPRKEAELKRLQEKIDLERKRLYDLQNAVKELKQLERDIQAAQGCLDKVKKGNPCIHQRTRSNCCNSSQKQYERTIAGRLLLV